MLAANLHILEVSNLGGSVLVDVQNRVWSVQVPSHLTNRGGCLVTVTSAQVRIPTPLTSSEVSALGAIHVETNIPIQGYTTASPSGQGPTPIVKLFSVELPDSSSTASSPRALYLGHPYSFRCPGGLPSRLSMRVMSPPTSVGLKYEPRHLYDVATSNNWFSGTRFDIQVEFTLSLQFDEI